MFNAALILRRAIQSLQPITLFPAEPADLSEEKIDVHVPSELYNFLSWIMTGKVQDMAPCLNKRVELDNCFLLMFFLDVLFNFRSFICVTEFSLACWYHFHVVHIAVMSKTYSYQKWNMDFYVLFNQQTQSLFTNTMFFCFMFHFTCMCKPRSSSNDFCFDGPYTVFILIYPHWFLPYPFKKSVGLVSFFSSMQHSHIHTVFKH